ncbi:MAG TPA: GDSL-type esterase/lipase family protein [Thermoanaerobaculia bacterium]|nr:GDSL-type esterase/lipase family protein [Thermoanaerobaculia bacterium]
MSQPLHVVTLGDSLAYGAGDETGKGIAGRLADDLHTSVTTTNLGVNGAQTADVLVRLKQARVRKAIADADAIVLSIGANDLFRSPKSRAEILRSPFAIAQRILDRIEEIVHALHDLNSRACVMLLGGYNPVPGHEWASLINEYLTMWDRALAQRFDDDALVTIVKMADVVTPQRLSRYDFFHPGSEAYREAARRIAEMLRRHGATRAATSAGASARS